MFAVCKHYSSDRDTACEYLQLGFITVFKKLDSYNFNGSLEGWIRRVIVNTILQEMRKSRSFVDYLEIEQLERVEKFESAEEIPDKSLINPADVINAVQNLPEKAALVLKLYVLEGLSHADISDQLGISIGTSKSQLNRARQLLKAKFY